MRWRFERWFNRNRLPLRAPDESLKRLTYFNFFGRRYFYRDSFNQYFIGTIQPGPWGRMRDRRIW